MQSGITPTDQRHQYPWAEWFDGNLPTIGTSPGGPWGPAEPIRNACNWAAKQKLLRVHAVADRTSDELRGWAERPDGNVTLMPFDHWLNSDTKTIELGPDSTWPADG